MEQKLNSNMENENLKLIKKYHDKAKTKLRQQYHLDQFGKRQGEYKSWFENGQIFVISNYKDGKLHGKYQRWLDNGRRWYIDTNHFKKGTHGTQISCY